MATLVTRLLTVNCEKQTKEVTSQDGNVGVFTAFKSLGEVAMRELMNNPDVTAAFGEYAKYMDQKKLEAVFSNTK